MNKVFLGLILAVCVLGMALVMLNDRLGRKPETRQAQVEETTPAGISPEDLAAAARARELEEAAAALAPPKLEETAERADEPVPLPEPLAPEPRQQAARDIPPRAEPAPEPDAPPIAPEPVRRPEAKPEPKPEPAPAQRAEAKPAPEPAQKAETKPAPRTEPERRAEVKPERKPEQKPAAAKAGNAGKGEISRFVIFAREKGATVRVGGNAKMGYSSMTLENPERVVVDLDGDWTFPANPGVPKNDLVSAVRVGQNGDKTRVVIDLKAKPRRVVLVPFKNGEGVDVRVDL